VAVAVPCCSLKCFMICIVSTSAKQTERTVQDYNVLLYTMVAGTWGVAARCLCRQRLGERERKNTLIPYYSQFRKHMKKNSLKWIKRQKITYRIYISVTSSSSPGFIYLRASHRMQRKNMTCHQNPGPGYHFFLRYFLSLCCKILTERNENGNLLKLMHAVNICILVPSKFHSSQTYL
jgi:hypothetical protein